MCARDGMAIYNEKRYVAMTTAEMIMDLANAVGTLANILSDDMRGLSLDTHAVLSDIAYRMSCITDELVRVEGVQSNA